VSRRKKSESRRQKTPFSEAKACKNITVKKDIRIEQEIEGEEKGKREEKEKGL